MVRIGVLSDTHIPVVAPRLPEGILEVFEREGVSLILHAGDVVVQRVLDQLLGVAPVRAVMGNMDAPPLQQVLPVKDIVQMDRARIGLIHGWGSPLGLVERVVDAFSGEDVNCIVFGHSHVPLNKRVGDVLLFNPGTPTDTRFTPTKTLGILEVEGVQVHGRHVPLP